MLNNDSPGSPLPEGLQTKIDLVLEAHDYDATQIVGILLDVQELNELHYVPEQVSYYLAKRLDMPVTGIFDCLSFYSELSDKPRAKYPLQVCSSIACRVNQSDSLASVLKELLGIDFGETTYDGRFTLEKATCFGACDRAPALRINGQVYGPLHSREEIAALLRGLD